VKVQTWGLDRWDQRKEQSDFFWAGHSRDGTGRLRTFLDGETKALPRPHSLDGRATINKAPEKIYQVLALKRIQGGASSHSDDARVLEARAPWTCRVQPFLFSYPKAGVS
jgi:hypothetical protein